MEQFPGCLVIVDISGYTSFVKMHRTALVHAEQIITELMETMLEKRESPLVLDKLQGDSAVFYALDDGNPEMASVIVEQVQWFFEAFNSLESELVSCNLCICDACDQIEGLRVKAVLHHGEIILKQMGGGTEIGGADIIQVHRLLKNSVEGDEYILMTRAFPIAILALPLTVRFIQIGIYDTVFAVALVHTALALPFAILVSSSLFMGIPRELEEAAWTMGCSRTQAFMKVVVPLALPGMAATAIFAFVISWNEVFAAAVLTLQNRTLTAYLLTQLSEAPLHFRFAGGFFLIIPSLIFIFAVRKYLFSMWGIANR
jgi:ABC-type proline/glycine betaine transport system permease subunit